MLRPARLPAVLVAAIVALAVTAPAAVANFPQTITGTAPPGGNLSATSSAIPPTATSATITAQPAPGTSSDVFDGVAKLLAIQPTRGRRVMACVAYYAAWMTPVGTLDDTQGPSAALGFLFLKACLHIALTLQPAARAAAAGCPQRAFGVRVRVRRANGLYTVATQGPPVRARPAVKVSCRRRGAGIELRLRSRSRARPLRKALGGNLALAYVNPSRTSSASIRTTFAVR